MTDELRRIGPASRPGPYLEDLVRELRAVREQVDHIADVLVAVVKPPLEQQFDATFSEVFGLTLTGAADELDAALDMIEAARGW